VRFDKINVNLQENSPTESGSLLLGIDIDGRKLPLLCQFFRLNG
jgi:hypothetical protein